MTIKNIVELTSVYLGLEDILSLETFKDTLNATVNPSVTADEITNRNLNLLIRCANLVLNKLASDYVKVTKIETLQTSSKKVNYDLLSEEVLKITNVKHNDKNIKFKPYSNYFEIDSIGEIEVEYNYLPSYKVLLADKVEEFDSFVGLRTIAYGTASEYCYISGMLNEAEMWEDKFKTSIGYRDVLKNKQMPARRWI